jgi:hypothetical protein
LLQTPLGLLRLDTDTVFPTGTSVTFAVQDTSLPAPHPTDSDDDSQLATAPTLFEQAQSLLPVIALTVETAPSAIQGAVAHLVKALIGLSAAVETGDLRSWLGEKPVSALEKAGHKDLVAKLTGEVTDLKTAVRMPLAGDWQSFILPLPIDQRIERIRLTFRRAAEKRAERRTQDDEGTRFFIDLDLSRLGPMQLDGLLQRKAKRFDLIMRSHQAIPPAMRRDIAALFGRSLDGLGLRGGASFQQTRAFIEPMASPPVENGSWVV